MVGQLKLEFHIQQFDLRRHLCKNGRSISCEKINRLDQRSSWYPIDPQAPVWLAQMGTIKGIRDIKPPLRLSISPYVSLYSQHYSDRANDISSSGFSYNGGMDLKYGINDAFTLDMTQQNYNYEYTSYFRNYAENEVRRHYMISPMQLIETSLSKP